MGKKEGSGGGRPTQIPGSAPDMCKQCDRLILNWYPAFDNYKSYSINVSQIYAVEVL